MYQTDNIKDLARELDIDYGSSSSSADQLRKIAEQVGIDNYNSLYDNDKLEKRLRELKREKYPDIRHVDATNNTSNINIRDKKNLAANTLKNKLQNNKNNRVNNNRMVNELASKGIQSMGVPKPLADAAINSKIGQKAIEKAKKQNLALNLLDKLTNNSKSESGDQASDGGSVGVKFSSKVIKRGLISCAFGFPIIIFICLFMSASQIMIKSVGLGNADLLSDQNVQDKINKKEGSDELSEEATEKEVSFDFFIDDNEDSIRNVKLGKSNLVEIASIKYYKRKYNEADLEQLEDFYPDVRDLSNKYDKNLVYDFFFKMYNLFIYYKNNEDYNVTLDLPLLMATLTIQSDDMSVIFSSNLSNEERKKKYNDKNLDSEDYADFDYYKDWSWYELTPSNSAHDMEILAQHMVSRQVRESCVDSSGNEVKYNILKDNQIGTQTLFCDEGQTYKTGEPYFDKDDVKYKEFLKEFIEKKYYESGTLENSNNNSNNNNSSSTGAWKNWKQCGESWSNIIVPKSNQNMCQIGCLITSITIQIARSGTAIVTDSIDPGIAVKKYSFVSGGNFIWSSTTNLAPNFKYKTAINLSGMSKESIAKKLSSYDSNKYYIVIAVSKKNKNKSNHYVALDYVDLQTNDLYMLDPGSSKDTNLYSTYKVYKAHIYEKKD